MKTYSIIHWASSFILFVLIFFSPLKSQSQQIITFIDGTERTVFITYQTKDTVKYYLDSRPDIVHVETMDHVDRITPLKPLTGYIPDSLTNLPDYKKYLHYKKMTTTGIVLMPIGAVLGGIGIAGLVSTEANIFKPDSFIGIGFSLLGIGVGCGLLLTGTIYTIVGAVNMQKYKKKLHGFSFDLKYTPQQKGISLVYRF